LIACRDTVHELRKEAVWAMSNVVYFVTDTKLLDSIVDQDVISLILELLQRDQDSGSITSLSLSTLQSLLSKSEKALMVFLRLGGQEVVEYLQMSEFHEVYKQASEIIERHCGGKEMDSLEKMEFINSKSSHFHI